MGVKDLWAVLTPFCERRPLHELHGKILAIDLAGWVCESLNVVDYFVHPRQYLKNLFFRTVYLLFAGAVPVFVLDGKAPDLKHGVISKRNEIQFRGVRPRENQSQKCPEKTSKGRTRFNHVLKQCENLLESMGLKCIQASGEAEAYCAHLNVHGLVDGIISQDSDCFAYGAIRVYRNFSISSQGSTAAQGGAVDIYDMKKIREALDFGQHKIIVFALLCGCDYCPEGVGGIGRESVLKLFDRYKNDEILDRIRSWRKNNSMLTSLEVRANDKNICSNCGHIGKTISHSKKGCCLCKTSKGCNESLWRNERLSIKAELIVKEKALANPRFPSEEIIDEFLMCPETIPKLDLSWKQPNLVKFIKQICSLLQWTEIYCFQKFLPLLTRWQISKLSSLGENVSQMNEYVEPNYIKKKRNPKAVPSYEIVWKDHDHCFNGLIPQDQIETYLIENPKGIEELWTTIEPIELVEKTYPEVVETFLISKVKPKKHKAKVRNVKKKALQTIENSSLNDMSGILEAAKDIERELKPKLKSKPKAPKGIQLISKFFKNDNSKSTPNNAQYSSTPKKISLSDIESEDIEETEDLSFIIKGIVSNPVQPVQEIRGKKLKYHQLQYPNASLNRTKDDLDLLPKKSKPRGESFIKKNSFQQLSDSFDEFDLMVNAETFSSKYRLSKSIENFEQSLKSNAFVFDFDENKENQNDHIRRMSMETNLKNFSNSLQMITPTQANATITTSFFFESNNQIVDVFEQSLNVQNDWSDASSSE